MPKLNHLVTRGARHPYCPTRGKVFAFVKTSFRNHVRSLVQKYAFTAKRTGVEPPPRLPLRGRLSAKGDHHELHVLHESDGGEWGFSFPMKPTPHQQQPAQQCGEQAH